ncbi:MULTISPECIES: dicarboxylate/amino acid:cation symporter [Ralstonia]|uniref:C4-dicarboxylate transport protein n=1 Tax=Ralstonia mannitolilytica TaxID=105219 RepID=A0AAJ5D4G7_9RALS|nr:MULTISPECIES: dicarboxylate/amino acid:cation symporter [Ralstonia]AJW44067.1 C4-dicarboxylate transporter [Ralstonia mannitolilytica]MBU9580283.1 dicarboxylate/amino acid:cation symporter [Ralstonia mannitolilytica]PLT16617.1 dicarboxylate/amino acid:cation symporter [Ralstonia mannitolilytica]QIF06439.1 dicarboxylate/amino acid:cation symporter [Ralstonia mannitolilytica]CAG2152041.1 C4-dicarboxylate transport protein 2 [Ralstonia mannitolilytica]
MKKPFYKILYVQVLAAIVIGVLLGHYSPALAVKMKPLGDGFIQLIKMVIGPIIFCTVVSGIAGMRDMKKVGRVGGKALIYFEIVSTFALVIGLAAGHIFNPGAGFNVDVNTIDAKAVAQYAAKAQSASTVDFLLNIIPSTVVDAFAKGDILQILLIALLFGGALSAMGERAQIVTDFIDQIAHVFFRIVHVITRVAPIGAFGAMAFTIGKYGVVSLVPLLKLIGTFYLTAVIFVVVVLGIIARLTGFSIFRFVAYIKEELLIVLGTSSSESALPHLMEKMEKLGCSKSVVGLVVPTGYSFNLDGTNIYMTMAVIFISQALNIELTWTQQLTILAVAMLTSKGASGITGAGFITLAATLAVVPTIPVAGMVLILGIDRFMSECRALTNITGNGVACVVISAWERELDRAKLARVLSGDRSDEGVPATPAA